MDIEDEDPEEKSKCSKCLFTCRKVTTFLLSHVGLISLVVGYCIMGAFTFRALEEKHELMVKRNMTNVRKEVTEFLWTMTQNTHVIVEEDWLRNTTMRLQAFETDLLQAMKKRGWDGKESEETQQWTFSGALFYSIVVITTIGFGHITPKTVGGKVVTIFYAIIGIPLMLLCLSHIGDFLADAFRFLYWKVCCYMCTRRPARRRHQTGTFRRGRSARSNPRHVPGSTRGMKRSASALRRSARTSQRSEDSAYSDSAIFSLPDPGIRRVHSDDHLRAAGMPMKIMKELSPPPFIRHEMIPSKNIQRSTRSAEPAFVDKKNLSILCNKYAEDVITDEPQHSSRRQPHVRVSRLRSPERYAYSDYWEDDMDTYESDDSQNTRKRPVPIWLCVLLVLSYILFGAFLFSEWETWNFLDSAYFCFVTLTTIGFGDLVPAQRVQNASPEVSIALCSLYLLFGISLLAMSFNLVQEEVISSVKLVATRLGIIHEED